MDNLMYVAYDADSAGSKIGRAILSDNPDSLLDASDRIQLGNELIADWAAQYNGKCYSSGGDQGLFAVPEEALEDLEHVRKDYNFATNLTVTVGVGQTLSQAGKALLVGKFRGKNMVVRYDDSVEKEIDAAREHVKVGEASLEEQKLNEAYLEPDGNEIPKEDREQSFADQDLSPPSIEKPDIRTAPPIGTALNAENLADNKEGDKKMEQEKAEDNNPKAAQAHSEEAMKEIASAIENDGELTEKDVMDNICAEDLASGHMFEGNVSRPEGFSNQNTPGDFGLATDNVEDHPNDESQQLHGVLQDSLDLHAEDMRREKVVNMIAQALEGFKSQKHVLERAKDKAPELYSSCLSMLKAMIEMSKMLGLGQGAVESEEVSEDIADGVKQDPSLVEENMEEQDAAPGEIDCPYCDPETVECPYCNPPKEEVECPYCNEEAEEVEKPEAEEGEEAEEAEEAEEDKKASPELPPEPPKAVPKEGAAPPPKQKGQ